jgi:hypothetical protein
MRSTDAEPGDAAYWSAAAATYDSAPDHGLADPGVPEAWPQRLAQWVSLLSPGGRFVFVEGEWSTGAGLTSDRTRALLEPHSDRIEVEHLTDPNLWGHPIEDDRYVARGWLGRVSVDAGDGEPDQGMV